MFEHFAVSSFLVLCSLTLTCRHNYLNYGSIIQTNLFQQLATVTVEFLAQLTKWTKDSVSVKRRLNEYFVCITVKIVHFKRADINLRSSAKAGQNKNGWYFDVVAFKTIKNFFLYSGIATKRFMLIWKVLLYCIIQNISLNDICF